MSKRKVYYKTRVSNQNITMEYSSETDIIIVTIERRLNNGAHIGTDTLEIHKSYVEPFKELLSEVIAEEIVNE